jgi:hypothetical protein
MGSWGTGVFQDDFGADVRDFYRDLVSLGFSDAAIDAAMRAEYAAVAGLDATTLPIAPALAQQAAGRPMAATIAEARAVIDSGRALAAWAALAGPTDRSIRARAGVLAKARAALGRPSAPPRRQRPDAALRRRIDRLPQRYPWRQGGIYALPTPAVTLVLAVTDVDEIRLQRHYATVPAGYALVGRPLVAQAALLLLDWRAPAGPDPAALADLQPFLSPMDAASRAAAEVGVAAIRFVWESGLAEPWEAFAAKMRVPLPHLGADQLAARYAEYHAHCDQQVARYADTAAAVDRQRHARFLLDPAETVPDALVDLGATHWFDRENVATDVGWEGLVMRASALLAGR